LKKLNKGNIYMNKIHETSWAGLLIVVFAVVEISLVGMFVDTSANIKKIQYPMLADNSGKISRMYGVYITEGIDEGRALRATFIIDPDGIVKCADIHDNSIGRSVKEVLRKFQAAKYVREHGGEVCPVEWEAGSKTLKPGINLVGKI